MASGSSGIMSRWLSELVNSPSGTSAQSLLPYVAIADAAGVPMGSTSNPSSSRSIGGSNIATGQVAVTTSATQIVPARAGRGRLVLSSTSAVVFYVGATGVTSATGLYVAAAAGATVTLHTSAAVFAVGASAVTISYLEDY